MNGRLRILDSLLKEVQGHFMLPILAEALLAIVRPNFSLKMNTTIKSIFGPSVVFYTSLLLSRRHSKVISIYIDTLWAKFLSKSY